VTEHKSPEDLTDAADDLAALPGVVDVVTITPDARLDAFVVELTVGPGYQRVPPRVLRCLGDHDLGIHDVTTRGDPTHHIVTAI
jgi:hypothetical protein